MRWYLVIMVLITFLDVYYSMNNMKVKKEIKFDSLIIRLYNIKDFNVDKSVGNIQAFDVKEKLIWTVQPPTYNQHYFDIQIDEDSFTLEADSGAGRVYNISLKNGHIISSMIIK